MRYIKILCILLLTFTATAGILFEVPRLPILNETIRVLYFHVPLWFTMIFLLDQVFMLQKDPLALYGPNAFNGVMSMTSKSPFEYHVPKKLIAKFIT